MRALGSSPLRIASSMTAIRQSGVWEEERITRLAPPRVLGREKRRTRARLAEAARTANDPRAGGW
jgi:hypothetical protein